MRVTRTALIVTIVLSPLLQAQDPARLVELLGDESQREMAAAKLHELGAVAVEPLLAAIAPRPADAEQADHTRVVLTTLASMRGHARQAVAPLVKQLRDVSTELEPDFVHTIADLVLFTPNEPTLASGRQYTSHSVSKWTMAVHRESARLRMRRDIGKGLDVARAVQLVNGVRTWSVEAGLDFLIDQARRAEVNRRRIAPALARSAKLLELADPRIGGTDQCIPIRMKAAELLLAAAPDSQAAERAKAVLGGAAPAATRAKRPLPARFTQRVDELIDALRDPKEREVATDNLVALGGPTAERLVAALAEVDPPEQREALLTALRRMGRHAAHVAHDLHALIWQLPMEHTRSLCGALAATGIWSRDVMNIYTYSMTNRSIKWDNRPLQGNVTSESYTGVAEGFGLLQAALAMDPLWSPERLVQQLATAQPDTQLLVLQVLRQRGSGSLPALDAVAEAMDATGIKGSRLLLEDNAITVESVDRSKEVQRAAARALLAIAPADDPRREDAQQLLGTERGGR